MDVVWTPTALFLAGVVLICAVAADARGEMRDVETYCRTIEAFSDGHPSPDALRRALAQVASRGQTRLDLSLSPFLPDPPKWEAPLDVARALAGAKATEAVTALVLDRFPLTVEAARILARSPHFIALRSLSIADTGATGKALQELLSGPGFPALVELDLTNNALRAADLERLASLLASRGIRRLAMGSRSAPPDVDRDGAVVLDAGRGLSLKEPGALDALVRVAATPSLATLDLEEEKLGVAGIEALLKVSRRSPLEIATRAPASLPRKRMEEAAKLDPDGQITFATAAGVTGAGALRALDASGLLAKVTTLHVDCGDACAKLVAQSRHGTRLREVVFGCEEDVPFTAATATVLARATGLSSLRRLMLLNDVEGCKDAGIGAAGIRALARAPLAATLESLELVEQNLDSNGWSALAGAGSFVALKELSGSEWEPFLTPAATRSLLRDGPLAKQLEVLRLMAEGQDWPVAELAKGLRMPNLRVLMLPAGGPDADRSWMAFARQPGTQRLEVLAIDPDFLHSDGGDSLRSKFDGELRKHLRAVVCAP